MSDAYKQAAIEAALQRRVGMTEEASVKLNTFLASQADWWAKCPKCAATLKGTPAQLKEHVCGTES